MLRRMMLLCAIAGLAVASAKTYTIVIGETSTVGTAQLMPGEYRVALNGSNVVFKNAENRTVAETAAKIETANRKFANTAVESKTVSGKRMIEDIELGGTTTKLVLN